ncbi:MAG: MBL fold metallo-hydrolase [Deltaproteobacteria bacterium]|nr:MBL fold metallo-hydrolase [Deltaproteobacteria bacterium]
MVQEISQDLFCIEVPLPNSPLKYLNSYVVRAPDRSLIIDTGLNSKVCLEAMENGLDTLGVDLANADIFITHFHADHFSLVPKLKKPTTQIFFNRPETELMENWQGFGEMLENAGRHGIPRDRLKSMLEAHPGSKFGADWAPELKVLSEGQTLNYGDYTFTCVETPGHTLGHICLYEAKRKIFVSGDHVLIDITPNIQCWTDHENPLKQYMESLEKVRHLDVTLVLPGHRRRFSDLESRIDELISHHEKRLDEVRDILDSGPLNAFETASRMTWDIKADRWEDFPVAQQWFATGEALSHLRYLEENGEIVRQSTGAHIQFALSITD